MLRFMLACLILPLVALGQAHAALVVIPNSAQTQEGDIAGNFAANFGLVSQELYRVADMTALHPGDLITGIALRLDGGEASYPSSTVTWTQYDIKVGPGNATLTSTFANNFASTPTAVRTGSLVMDPGFFPNTGSPRDFSTVIAFNTPYVYTGGDLLFEFRTIAPNQTLLIDTMSGAQTTGQSIFNLGNSNATTATDGPFGDNWAMALQISPVPEPSTYAMALAGLACGGYSMFRRRKRA